MEGGGVGGGLYMYSISRHAFLAGNTGKLIENSPLIAVLKPSRY